LVPPLTSTLLGSVEKSRSGIAAGVLNATRQTGSVLGAALFGALTGPANAFIAGTRQSLIIAAIILLGAALAILVGTPNRRRTHPSTMASPPSWTSHGITKMLHIRNRYNRLPRW
jgi:DHA2 family methylenomycin A resistance protein-like MFS transporter